MSLFGARTVWASDPSRGIIPYFGMLCFSRPMAEDNPLARTLDDQALTAAGRRLLAAGAADGEPTADRSTAVLQ